MFSEGKKADELRATVIQETLGVVYRILCIQLGAPPTKFDWSYRSKLSSDEKSKGGPASTTEPTPAATQPTADSKTLPSSIVEATSLSVASASGADTPSSKSKKKAPTDPFKAKTQYLKHTNLTPLSFYHEFVVPNTASAPKDGSVGLGGGVEGAVSLVHDPRNAYYKLYTVSHLGNVMGGSHPVRYVNVPIDVLKLHARKRLITDRLPCWFGCDVGQCFLLALALRLQALV